MKRTNPVNSAQEVDYSISVEKSRITLVELLRRYNVLITLVVMVVFASATTSGLFLGFENLLNVGERASVVGIVALGQMLVILTGGIDLSVGGLIAIALTVIAKTEPLGVPPPLAILLAICASMMLGALNGFLISKSNVPPFMITMGAMLFHFSLATWITGAGQLEYYHLQDFLNHLFRLNRFGARLLPTFTWLLFSFLLIYILGRSRFGHNVYAIGGKETAAVLSGVRSGTVKILVYMLSGLFCALAAIVLAYRLGASNPNIGTAFLLESIAAVVIGGTSLFGGEGSIYGTLVGAFIMATLVNLLNLLNANPYLQEAIKGIMLVGFVFIIQTLSRRK
jgi:ribose transport system permease protein